MILPDTSVWIDHFRRSNPLLAELLDGSEVLCHPFVIGELACGWLKKRDLTLGLLQTLEEVPMAEHDEVLQLIERHELRGTGIGWLDAHLLASALLGGAKLWTLDKPLAHAAAKLSVLARPAAG
jgi:predicted nucleic acid-binding protein